MDRVEQQVIFQGVESFERLRRFAEPIYLYGSFTRDSFEKKNIGSKADYDFVLGYMKRIFPEMEYDTTGDGTDDGVAPVFTMLGHQKQHRIARRYESSGEERMTRLYSLYTARQNDMLSYFSIISVLNTSNRPMTASEICARISLTNSEMFFGEPASDASVRRRIKDLADAGYVREENKKFRRTENWLQMLDTETLKRLWQYVSFCSSVSYPRVAGAFLLNSIKRELITRGVQNITAQSLFIMRNHESRSVFDEAIVYIFMDAINQRKQVLVTMEKGQEVLLTPISLMVDDRLGRWYAVCNDGKQTSPRRISKMKSAKIVGQSLTHEDWERLHSSRDSEEQSKKEIRAKLLLDGELGNHMLKLFTSEMRAGCIKEEQSAFWYIAETKDAGEILPYLRSFAEWIDVQDGRDKIKKRIYFDVKMMLKNLYADMSFGNAQTNSHKK